MKFSLYLHLCFSSRTQISRDFQLSRRWIERYGRERGTLLMKKILLFTVVFFAFQVVVCIRVSGIQLRFILKWCSIIRRLLNRLCSLLFCWQISAGGCVLIWFSASKFSNLKKKKNHSLRIHSFLPASKQEEEEEEEDKEEEETLLERALLLLRKSSIATTCRRELLGSLFCV